MRLELDSLSPIPQAPVWVCLGMVDEWHPFCPFATRNEEEAKAHAEIPGHWVRNDVEPTGLWAETLTLGRPA